VIERGFLPAAGPMARRAIGPHRAAMAIGGLMTIAAHAGRAELHVLMAGDASRPGMDARQREVRRPMVELVCKPFIRRVAIAAGVSQRPFMRVLMTIQTLVPVYAPRAVVFIAPPIAVIVTLVASRDVMPAVQIECRVIVIEQIRIERGNLSVRASMLCVTIPARCIRACTIDVAVKTLARFNVQLDLFMTVGAQPVLTLACEFRVTGVALPLEVPVSSVQLARRQQQRFQGGGTLFRSGTGNANHHHDKHLDYSCYRHDQYICTTTT